MPAPGRRRRPRGAGADRRRHPLRRARSPSPPSAREPARTSLWDGPDPIPHTRLGQGADLVVVAPATARLLGAYAAGHLRRPADRHPAGHPGPGAGLPGHAHRDVGAPGRAGQPGHAAPAGRARRRARAWAAWPAATSARAGWPTRPTSSAAVEPARSAGRGATWPASRVLVTAGGTREPIDPVRFIGNRSSGKQGHAIADEAAARGATVTLVTTDRPARRRPAPTSCAVETAAEMEDGRAGPGRRRRRGGHGRRRGRLPAQGGRRPQAEEGRRRRPSSSSSRRPTSWPRSGRPGGPGQVLVGFAAETASAATCAPTRPTSCAASDLDLIVANDVSAPGVGFDHDTNAVVILGADGIDRRGPADRQASRRRRRPRRRRRRAGATASHRPPTKEQP